MTKLEIFKEVIGFVLLWTLIITGVLLGLSL